MIVRLAEGTIKTTFGEFKEYLYYDGKKESIAFVKGDIENQEDILCRIHSSCIFGHYFNSIECDCKEQMDAAQKLIHENGKGIIILLEQEGKGNGHFALLNSVRYKRQGSTQAQAYQQAGFQADARDFSSAAKILNDLNIKSVRMISENLKKTETLTQFGIEVKGIKTT